MVNNNAIYGEYLMHNPIRILHVVSEMQTGGIQSFLISLYRNLDREKIQFDFLIHYKSDDSYEKEILELGGNIYYQQPFRIVNISSYKKSVKRLLENHPENTIVHIHMRSVASIWGEISKKLGRGVIIHSHSTSNGYSFKALVTDYLQSKCKIYADYFLGCSREANMWMFGKEIANSSRCFVINNGIKTEEYVYSENKRTEVRSSLLYKDDDIVLGTVGRLVPQKDHKFMLEIYKYLRAINPSYKLMIVGEGELREELEQYVSNNELTDGVLFLGKRNDVNVLLQGMDIFLLTSKNEGLGIAAIEAQASGLPTIVSSNVPDEVIITNICHKMKSKDVSEWVNYIEKVDINDRHNTKTEIANSKYDILDVVNQIQEIYMELYNENKESIRSYPKLQ